MERWASLCCWINDYISVYRYVLFIEFDYIAPLISSPLKIYSMIYGNIMLRLKFISRMWNMIAHVRLAAPRLIYRFNAFTLLGIVKTSLVFLMVEVAGESIEVWSQFVKKHLAHYILAGILNERALAVPASASNLHDYWCSFQVLWVSATICIGWDYLPTFPVRLYKNC